MRFDGDALGGGLYVSSLVENGKAMLEFTVSLIYEEADIKAEGIKAEGIEEADIKAEGIKAAQAAEAGTGINISGADVDRRSAGAGDASSYYMVEILMLDRDRQTVASAVLPVSASGGFAPDIPERPLPKCPRHGFHWQDTIKSLLIYPHLWQSVEDPYLYTVRACLLCGEEIKEELTVCHAVRSFSRHPTRGYLLNGQPFPVHAVRYRRENDGEADRGRRRLAEDLQMLLELGANTLCLEGGGPDAELVELCERKGLLIWCGGRMNDIPQWSGGENGLVTEDRRRKRDEYYRFRALWSNEPFLHICRPEYSDDGQTGGSVCVYSNQKRMALYVDGVLFEWKETGPDFLFQDVPLERAETVLSAQSGNLYSAMTIRRQESGF